MILNFEKEFEELFELSRTYLRVVASPSEQPTYTYALDISPKMRSLARSMLKRMILSHAIILARWNLQCYRAPDQNLVGLDGVDPADWLFDEFYPVLVREYELHPLYWTIRQHMDWLIGM